MSKLGVSVGCGTTCRVGAGSTGLAIGIDMVGAKAGGRDTGEEKRDEMEVGDPTVLLGDTTEETSYIGGPDVINGRDCELDDDAAEDGGTEG